jgi:hypothetical protein
MFLGSVFSFAPTYVQQGKMTRQQVFRSGGSGAKRLARAAF